MAEVQKKTIMTTDPQNGSKHFRVSFISIGIVWNSIPRGREWKGAGKENLLGIILH